ncbi:beta strand repeat-containing protein [Runella salmonicolor]|nr:3-coathanger stack domain-containing protein [Runella salmonicolor]
MVFYRHLLNVMGLMYLGILSVIATPTLNPNKHLPVAVATVTWVGGTAGFAHDWNTPSNWSTNVVPTNTDKVIIPGSLAHYPVLNTNVSIQTLNIEAGATLTVNASNELTIAGIGDDVRLIVLGTVENNGTITVNQITSNTANAMQLSGDGQFKNNTGATLSAATIGFYGIRVEGNSVLLNQVGGTISFAGFSGSMFLSGSASPESVQNHGKLTLAGQIEKYAGTFHNYPCGVVSLLAGEVYNNGGQIINEGFFSAAANLNGPAADFINNGIVYVGGAASYTNNKIRIFNDALPNGIFEFGASNDLTVSGIYKDDAATALAGDYNQASNTFTHFGLSAGSQTLYAKITRLGGSCPQIVPFTFEVTTASTFTSQPGNQVVCAGGAAVFTVAIANAAGYQWQLNTGSGWNNVPAISPYSNTTTATLNISNVTGLDGYQYRCVASSTGGATLASTAATLTIGTGGNPTGTLTWTGLVDTDWNTACNWTPSSVPTATNDVVIPATTNEPIIGSGMSVAQNITITGSGASLTVNAGATLTISSTTFSIRVNNAAELVNKGTINLAISGSSAQSGLEVNDGSIVNYGVLNVTNLLNEGIGLNSGTINNKTGGTINANGRVGTYLVSGTLTNESGASFFSTGSNSSMILNGGSGSIDNSGLVDLSGQVEILGTEQIVNNACGRLKVRGSYYNQDNSATTNQGLIQISGLLQKVSSAIFTNNGVLKYGSLTGTVTNATNSSLIVNNTPTPIFTYGGTYDGVINGIFKDSLTTLSAGTFTAPNTFAPSGLPTGTQTLYAKITPQGGACSYVVPFSFAIAPGDYTWTGALSKDWNMPDNWLVEGNIPTVVPTFGSQTGNHTLIPVVANGNYPEVSAASGARSVTIAANASLTIKSTGNLKIVGSDTDGVTNAGTFTNNGTVLIDSSYNDGFVNQAGASLINTSAFTVQRGTGNRLENYGSLNNSGTFTVGGGLGTAILNHPAATLTNTSTFGVSGGLTGGIVNQGTVDNSGQLTFNGGVSETLFVNQETVTNRSGATMTIGSHKALLFDNQKLVENEGTFNIGGGGDRGAINREGATIRNKVGGTFYVAGIPRTLFRNSGYLENYHIVSFSGTPDTCFYNLPTGEVKNEATFILSGIGSVNGAIINLGRFTHGSAGALNFSGVGGVGFKNAGTFKSTAGCSISAIGGVLGLLQNMPNALFENKCATTFRSGGNPIVNQGRYTHTAGSFTVGNLNTVLENSGYAMINVPFTSTGQLGQYFVNSDTLLLGPQTVVTTSPMSNHGIPLTNTSTGYVHSEADFVISATTTIIDNAGKIVLGSQSSISGVNIGTPIINTGNLTNEGTVNFNRFGGYGIDNSGTFVNKGRFETGNSDKSIHNNGGTIENSGVMEIDSVFRDAVLQKGSGSSFTNTATGQINIDFVFGNGINNTAGGFVNNGEMMIAQTDTVALSGINNAGTFQNNKLMRIGGVGKIKQHGIYNTGTLTNTTDSRIVLQSAEGSGITNQGGTVTNQSCAYIESTPVILNAAGTFSNAGVITKRSDNLMVVSNISTNSGTIVNEDADAFTVTGTNSGAVVGSASIAYVGSPFANTGAATVTLSGATGGTFSATPSGLSLNPTTGEINLAASTPQSYVVTYTIAAAGGSCPAVTDTAWVSIKALNVSQIVYVNGSNTSPGQDGSSWSNAFTSLQAGLSAAAALTGEDIQVWVAAGTYKPGTLRKDVFEIPSGVRVYGGFAGGESELNQRNWRTQKTILSGEIGTSVLSDNVNHVVVLSNTNEQTRLDGFVVEKGYADYFVPTQGADLSNPTILSSGGGILVLNRSRGLITNCVITNNRAIGGGGILLRDSSEVSITNSIIVGNEATFGGGIYMERAGQPHLENLLIVSNKGVGGGLYLNYSAPILTHCTIASNQSANSTPGGIFNTNSSVTLQNSILWDNSGSQTTSGISIRYSIVQGGFAGTGNMNRDPLFVKATPLGLSPTVNLGDYRLQVCSPAINAGDNAASTLTVDLDGNVRPFATGLAIVDLGCYESQSTGGGGPAVLNVSEPITGGTVLKTGGRITATNQVSGATVEYRGSQSVALLPGFGVTGSVFEAVIGGCDTVVPTARENNSQK